MPFGPFQLVFLEPLWAFYVHDQAERVEHGVVRQQNPDQEEQLVSVGPMFCHIVGLLVEWSEEG